MLTDTERKILLMLWNRNRYDPAFIRIPLFARLAGREEKQVFLALRGLAEKFCIEWDPVKRWAKVIDVSELAGPPPKPVVKPWWEWDD